MSMRHIQGTAIYIPRQIVVVVVAISNNGQCTILLPNGSQLRIAKSSLKMLD